MVFAQLEARLGYSLSPTTIVQAPTIARLADFIRATTSIASAQSLVPLRASGTGLPLFLVHNRYCFVMYYRHLLNISRATVRYLDCSRRRWMESTALPARSNR